MIARLYQNLSYFKAEYSLCQKVPHMMVHSMFLA